MAQKWMLGILCLAMVPMMQGCDDRDVATGVVAGAVVGGTIAAVASDNYYNDYYYRTRYTNYYGPRHVRYGRVYGPRYYGPRYGHYRNGGNRGQGQWRHRGNQWRHRFEAVELTAAQPAKLSAVENFADFYQMPMASAEIIWGAQQKALNGDVSGLAAIGLFSKDVERLVQMQAPSKDTVYRMSIRTGLSESHAKDVLKDFQEEFKASLEAGRLSI